ncbi:hypothetical protein HDU67_010182, partial [Dinochytrium kinnereticum]
DEALIRKRAEHNDGELSTLKEVTLHQYDIEKIENLDVFCKQLEILYLQNNLISRIENLGKLKCLRYLNLALNNIKVVEGLEGCESLEKLDLTVNFVNNPLDLESLKANAMLRELFLVGNPVTAVENYRSYTVWTLKQLKVHQVLDGLEIEKSERISAGQIYDTVLQKYRIEFGGPTKRNSQDEAEAGAKNDEQLKTASIDQIKEDFNNKPIPYTPESRIETAKAIQKLKGISDEKPSKPKEEKPLYGPDGRVLQRNEGKWKFWFTDDKHSITLHVELSKFLDSSLINVEPCREWIRIDIKGKVLQLVFDEEVEPDEIACERSKLSGVLVISMKKASAGNGPRIEEIVTSKKKLASKPLVEAQKPKDMRNRRLERLMDGVSAAYIKDARVVACDISKEEDFVDDPSVPPLC